MSGTLYIVSTPIGNSRDITLRALDVLKSADLLLCEDTRETRKLLAVHGISARTESFFAASERGKTARIVKEIAEGKNIALVSSRGTPAVSDPGFFLIKEAVAARVKVVPVPGPSAAISAVVASGFPADDFVFIGFLKRKSGKMKKQVSDAARLGKTVVFFESPQRIAKTLAALAEIFPAATRVCVAREMTKTFEEFLRGGLTETAAALDGKEIKGEITVVLSPYEEKQS